MRTSVALSLTIIAAVCIMAFGGCVGMRPDAPEQQPQQQQANNDVPKKVLEARTLAQASKYTEAVAAYQLVLQEHPDTEWAPEAKYGIALAFVSADNPQKDYSAAVKEFDEFLSLYPSDKRAAEAKSWRQTLKVLLDAKKDNDRLNKNIEKLKMLDLKQEEKRLGR
jgi:outer membrane protein assembly factor BamD (BamD/ComL family)